MITKTSAEAQNQFGKLLDLAQREPVAITRHGRPAAYVISPHEMALFEAFEAERRQRAVADFRDWAASYGSQISPKAAELTDDDIVRMVHEAREEIDAERSESEPCARS